MRYIIIAAIINLPILCFLAGAAMISISANIIRRSTNEIMLSGKI